MYLLHQSNLGKLTAVAFSIVITSTVSAGPGNYNPQGPKLLGSGAVGNAAQGMSVAVSADGNTALFSGPFDDSSQGAAWVFARANGEWSQQGEKVIVGAGIVLVALSADGGTAAIGSRSSIYVFSRLGGVWTQQQIISYMDTGDGVGSIYSLALSGDGSTLVIGDPFAREDENDCTVAFRGEVEVFIRSNGIWNFQTNIVGVTFGDDCNLTGDSLGNSVLLSMDGNTLAVQAGNNVNVYMRSGTTWTQQTEFHGNVQVVGLTADGNNILLAGQQGFTASGFISHRKNSTWSNTNQTVELTATQPRFTTLSADGTTVAGQFENSDGSASIAVFALSGGVYKLQNEYGVNGQFGCSFNNAVSIALSANGNTLIEGSPCDNNGAGGVQPFATPQLSTSLTHTGHFTQGETGVSYTITVSNVGDRDVHAAPGSAIIVVDKLPSSLAPTAIFGGGWTCTLATVSCTRDDGLLVGESLPSITVIVNVASNAPSSVTNAATASGGGSNWGNATDVTTIVPKP